MILERSAIDKSNDMEEEKNWTKLILSNNVISEDWEKFIIILLIQLLVYSCIPCWSGL